MTDIKDIEVENLAKSNFEKNTGRAWDRLNFSSRGSNTPEPPATEKEKHEYRLKALLELSKKL